METRLRRALRPPCRQHRQESASSAPLVDLNKSSIILNTESIIYNTKSIILNSKSIDFNANLIIL